MSLTPWIFEDVTEWNFRWLACHPWIEVTTPSEILKKNWTAIDHGDLGLPSDQPLEQYTYEGDWHYHSYFWQSYYGSISDGHSPLIPAGEIIEGLFDYIPYLRNGQPIPSGRKIGDDKTSGTIVYETLHNLRAAPDNSLTRLAWLSYFMSIAEYTTHAQTYYQIGKGGGDVGGQYLHSWAKVKANCLRQVNKIVTAAHWADEAARQMLSDSTRLLVQDLDLDGEDEYVMKNNKIFAVFENDAGRIEYTFAYDPAIAGPVQLVAPVYQFIVDYGCKFEEGESPLPDWPFYESCFEDDNPEIEGGKYRYDIYAALIDDDQLTFFSSDNRIRKTFTLEGNTIYAHYVTDIQPYIAVGFGLPVNPANMYSRDWPDKVIKIESPEAAGCKVTDSGYAVVNFMDTRFNWLQSFTDSPAREEMRRRDDPSTYPSGHHLYFPYNSISVFGSGEFDVSLTLSAKEISSSVEQAGEKRSRQFSICQNYPNPFNPVTVIEYQLSRPSEVEICIFNLQGQKVVTLLDEYRTAGSHKIVWNSTDEIGRSVASGIYYYQLKAGDLSMSAPNKLGQSFVIGKKMVLLR